MVIRFTTGSGIGMVGCSGMEFSLLGSEEVVNGETFGFGDKVLVVVLDLRL